MVTFFRCRSATFIVEILIFDLKFCIKLYNICHGIRISIECRHMSGYKNISHQTKSVRFCWKSAQLSAYFRWRFNYLTLDSVTKGYKINLHRTTRFHCKSDNFQTNLYKYGTWFYSSQNKYKIYCVKYGESIRNDTSVHTHLGEFFEALRFCSLEPGHEVSVGHKVTLTGRVTWQSQLTGILTQCLTHLIALSQMGDMCRFFLIVLLLL